MEDIQKKGINVFLIIWNGDFSSEMLVKIIKSTPPVPPPTVRVDGELELGNFGFLEEVRKFPFSEGWLIFLRGRLSHLLTIAILKCKT